MVLFNVLMAILYPLAPVVQLIEGVRRALACFLKGFEDPAYLEELKGDYAQLAELDRAIADMEAILHIAVWHMARFKLGLPYKEHRRNGRARPGNRLTVDTVFGRFQRVSHMLGELERLAVRRAWRLKRLIDANPLGLVDHRPSATTTISCISPPTMIPFATTISASTSASAHIRAPP
jgi:hypothetical protein